MTIELNPGQARAVRTRASRIVVSAGAGSGKTRVLVQRFVDRVLESEGAGHDAPLRSVLLITFTDKAAGELTERVRTALLAAGRADLAREVDSAWISTIHSFCSRIVRRHALELGVDVGFAVLTDPHAGIERSEAFERAARRCLEAHETASDVAALVEEGVADLRTSVLAGYDRARSRGVAPADVEVPVPAGLGPTLETLARTLEELLPEYEGLVSSATSHANLAGFKALRAEVEQALRATGVRVSAEATVRMAVHRGALTVGGRTKELTALLNDALAAAVQSAVDTIASFRAEAWRALLVAFAEEYDAAKASASLLDFEDLQLLTLRLWRERPDIAARFGEQFVEVMVDEFQDTNPLQMQVIEPISWGGQCVVGDVQQSIYRFRDADVGLLQGKQADAERAPDACACNLTVNYRSDARLVAGLNVLFGSDDFFGDGYLHLESGADAHDAAWPDDAPVMEGLIVDKSACPDGDWRRVEARALAARLRAIVDAGRAAPDDIVVLLRASTTMPVYVAALREAGFDVVAPSSGGFYATREYADVRALVRSLANPLDDEGMLGLLAGGLGGVSDDGLLALAAAREHGSLWSAVRERAGSVLGGADLTTARRIATTLERLRENRGRLPLADAIRYAAEVLGPEGGLFQHPSSRANVRKIARIAAEFEGAGVGDPAEFLSYLDDRETFVPRETAAGSSEGSGSVRVMTVHAAKGLEFPVVAVADLGHGTPNRHAAFLLVSQSGSMTAVSRGPERGTGDKTPRASAWQAATDAEKALDLEEGKRVFYVACTRAQRALLLVGSTDASAGSADGTAAGWVLDAADRIRAELPGVMGLTILGAEAVESDEPPDRVAAAAPPDRQEAMGLRETVEAPRLPTSEPLSPPSEVSYTALALYDACAYRFFAERMLRVGSLDGAVADDPKSFGSALHAALELVARGEIVDADRLRGLAVSHGLPAPSVERLIRARASVAASGIEPLMTRGRPEVPFAVAVDGGVVRGTMDLVIIDGDTATVLDYKTGGTWDAAAGRYAAQAEVYALALLESGVSPVEVRFVHVEAGCETSSHSFTAADGPGIREKVERTLRRMGSGDFPPLRAYDHLLCADCPVSGSLCPVVHPHTGRKRSRQSGAERVSAAGPD